MLPSPIPADSAVTVSPWLTTVGYGRFFGQIPRLRSVKVFPITTHEALDTGNPVYRPYMLIEWPSNTAICNVYKHLLR
jgi:hypothetical protein